MNFQKLFVIVLVGFASLAQAQLDSNPQAEVIGRVVIDENQTLVCMGLQCPPSVRYYQLVLDDAQIVGLGPVENVVFQDFEQIVEPAERPTHVEYGGVRLKEGVYVMMKAHVQISALNNRVIAVVSNPEEVKIAPSRFPVILY